MEAKSTTPESRTRDGRSLRERHAEQTREVILEALAEQLAKDGFADFDIPSLARRAGVSVRTVYRHFRSRDALLEGLADWVNTQITPFPRPASVDDLADLAEALFAAFDEHETILRAQSATDQGRALRAEGRRQHLRMYEEVLSDVTAQLPPEEARAAVAVITYLLSSLAWRTMREEFGLGGADSGKAVAWAVGVLIADLRRRAASQPTTGSAAGEPASAPGHHTSEKGERP